MPEFILVTGPNASGKTSFIDHNAPIFNLNNFTIIIPDRLLNRPHSLDRDTSVIENLYKHINAGKNIVFETPFQFDAFAKTIDFIYSKGYHMSLYQFFVNTLDESAIRVTKRNNNGGLFIKGEIVKENFNANFANVARFYFYFHESYFVENAIQGQAKLLAAFRKTELRYYSENNSDYIRYLFNYSARLGRMDEGAMEIIKANKNFTASGFETGSRLRLDF